MLVTSSPLIPGGGRGGGGGGPGSDTDAIHDNVAAEISVIVEKAVPDGADLLVIEDSAAANAKKKLQVGNLPVGSGAGIDTTAIHDNVAAEISIVTEKIAVLAADLVLIEDSAAGNAKKRVQLSNLLALFLSLGGTLTAHINLGENAGLRLDTALSADGQYSGITEEGTAGAALAFGDLCYLQTADSRWELTDANAAAAAAGDSRNLLGICVLAAAADGDSTRILVWGKVRADAKFPALTIGAPVYVSETAGLITPTQPVTADVVIRVIGFGKTADELFFCPSSDYITHT